MGYKYDGRFTWILGTLQDGSGGLKFVRAGSDGGEWPVRVPCVVDNWLRMAKVCADDGFPVGPVIEIGRALDSDPEDTLRRWNEYWAMRASNDR